MGKQKNLNAKEPGPQENMETQIKMWKAYISEIKRTEGIKRIRLIVLLISSITTTIAMILGYILDWF